MSKQKNSIKQLLFLLLSLLVFLTLAFIAFRFLSPKDNSEFARGIPPLSKNNPQFWHNPKIPWHERFFCKGSVRAFFCDEEKIHHPFKDVMDSYEIDKNSAIAEKLLPKTDEKNRVIQYTETIN